MLRRRLSAVEPRFAAECGLWARLTTELQRVLGFVGSFEAASRALGHSEARVLGEHVEASNVEVSLDEKLSASNCLELTTWGEKHGKSRENGGFRGRNEGFRGLWRLFRLRNEAFFLGVKAEEVHGCVREAGHEQRRLHRLGGAPEVLRGSVHQDQGPEHVRNACDAVFGRGKQVMFIDFHRFSSMFIVFHRFSSISNAFWRRNVHFRPCSARCSVRQDEEMQLLADALHPSTPLLPPTAPPAPPGQAAPPIVEDQSSVSVLGIIGRFRLVAPEKRSEISRGELELYPRPPFGTQKGVPLFFYAFQFLVLECMSPKRMCSICSML